jgi:hypothetical protein
MVVDTQYDPANIIFIVEIDPTCAAGPFTPASPRP